MAFMAAALPYIAAAATAVSSYSAYKGMQNQKAAAQKQSDLAQQQLDLQQQAAEDAKKAQMPNPDDAASQAARRRSISEQTQARGRASTILTSPSGSTLGG